MATLATTTPRRITVTRSVIAMISRSLWVIRITVRPCRLSAARMRNSSSASCGVSTPVGSSRISISAPRYSAFRISNPLLDAHRQLLYRRVEINHQPIFLLQAGQGGTRPAQPLAQQRSLLGAQQHVLQHRERLHQHEVLVHHADAGGDGVRGTGEFGRAPVDLDAPRVRPIQAIQDAHQGRLAGAVLADDAVDRPLRHLQRDVAVGANRPEPLVDATQCDRGPRSGTAAARRYGQELVAM